MLCRRGLFGLAASVLLLAVVFFTGFAWAEPVLTVTVSLAPQKYFVEKIGRELVSVSVMVPAGASPATYEPRPRQMTALMKSRIYFAVGAPFEAAWLPRIAAANEKMIVVHTEAEVPRRPMAAKHGAEDASSPEDDHLHTGLDPHIWLAPPLVKIQAAAIRDALAAVDPAHAPAYAANHAAFAREIDALDRELKAMFRDVGQRNRLMVFHPAWGYFARAYGLEQIPIEREGKEPGARGLKRLVERARAQGVRAVFVQPQFSTREARLIAASIGARSVAIDPLAEDWAANLRRAAAEIKKGLW